MKKALILIFIIAIIAGLYWYLFKEAKPKTASLSPEQEKALHIQNKTFAMKARQIMSTPGAANHPPGYALPVPVAPGTGTTWNPPQPVGIDPYAPPTLIEGAW